MTFRRCHRLMCYRMIEYWSSRGNVWANIAHVSSRKCSANMHQLDVIQNPWVLELWRCGLINKHCLKTSTILILRGSKWFLKHGSTGGVSDKDRSLEIYIGSHKWKFIQLVALNSAMIWEPSLCKILHIWIDHSDPWQFHITQVSGKTGN